MDKTKGRICVFCEKEIKPDDEMGEFTIVLHNKVENAHKSCYNKYKAEKSNIRIKIR